MAISDNVRRVQKQIEAERMASDDGATSQISLDLRDKAIKAMFGGAAEWDDYMKVFATDANNVISQSDLAKLRPEEPIDNDNFDRNKARAYLLGNGTCGSQSPLPPGLDFTVGTTLD